VRALLARWPVIVPLLAIGLLVAALNLQAGPLLAIACGVALAGAVVAAVHHGVLVAHRLGEPFGTLGLALAVTAIESSLIVSLMLAGGASKAALARDTIYATVMIIVNGVVGACVLLGALRHREQTFRIEGAGPALEALATLVTLVLVLPAFTVSAEGPLYTPAQLGFVAVSSLAMWCVFVFFQTIRHRDYFLPPADAARDESVHAAPPTARQAWGSFALLLVALVAVVGLAKVLSPTIEAAVRSAGAPPEVVGIAIALLVLMPESVAAIRSALADRLQTSMNLALGSALASIGLTIPVVVAVCLALGIPLVLGLESKDIALLVLTFFVCGIGIGSGGRTNMMVGMVQLVIFSAFLFLAVVP
jgi:Ca2+:H+ antiporter